MSARSGRGRVAWLATAVLALNVLAPVSANAATPTLTADLGGAPIPLREIIKYHCQDLDYPRIHCFTSEASLEVSAAALLSTPSSAYVIAWDQPTYAGSSFIFTQDYTALALIGWSDRISSFKAQNSQTGHWYTDWFYNGSSWYICCNAQQSSLGSFNDTFSSVHRF